MTIQRERIDGLSIRVRRAERPSAPTLLLTNAWPLSIRCWDDCWERFADYNLLAYDMPGFGLSEGGSEHMSPSKQAAFALKVMDHFDLDKVHAVGPDVGVPAVLWLASHHPERLQSAVVFNGPGTADAILSWELRAIVASQAFRTLLARFGGVFASEAIRRGYERFKPGDGARAEYRSFNKVPEKFRHTLEYLARYPEELPLIDAKLAQLAVPVLILWGDRDPFLKIENARKLHERIPGSQLQILKGCGHFAHEDGGEQFAKVVGDWCQQHAG